MQFSTISLPPFKLFYPCSLIFSTICHLPLTIFFAKYIPLLYNLDAGELGGAWIHAGQQKLQQQFLAQYSAQLILHNMYSKRRWVVSDPHYIHSVPYQNNARPDHVKVMINIEGNRDVS